MSDWSEIALQSSYAARDLKSNPRSSASRAYYAAYSAITSRLLLENIQFPQGYSNPKHRAVPKYILQLTKMTEKDRRKLKSLVRALYAIRLDADYQPGHTVDERIACQARIGSNEILSMLGVFGES